MMTRDKILNMPAGREMDALIAEKVMGIDPIPFDDETKCPECESTMRFCGSRSWCSSCHEWIYSPYKEYSTDIRAAFEVIQKMHEMKYKYTLHGHFMGSELQIATFDHQDWADANPLYKAVADTAPLAICRAALLAVMK